jgi:hypothetical protein
VRLGGIRSASTGVSLPRQLQPIVPLERGKSMRSAILIAACLATVAGCAPTPRPGPVPRVALPPFDDAPVSFVVATAHFPPGVVTILRVCLAPDHSIRSVDVMASSGDRRFDDMAMTWARQVRVRPAPNNGSPMDACGEVRVEIRTPSEPRVIAGPDSSLS